MTEHAQNFKRDGYLLIREAIDPQFCSAFAARVLEEYDRLVKAGWSFTGSGRLSGHLNIRMGREGAALYGAFQAAGLENLVKSLAEEPARLIQAVGNLNMPGSCWQDYHLDGSFERRILIANICLVPTDSTNGATQIVPESDRRENSYWRFVRDGWRERMIAPATQPGDVLVRPSNLWHRGAPNRSTAPRPMAAFAYSPTRFLSADHSFTDLDGPLTIFSNKYYGRLRTAKEVLAARLPLLDEMLRQGRSFVTERNRGRAS